MKGNLFKECIIFLIGGVAGAAATYMYINKKSEERINDEIKKLHNYHTGDKKIVPDDNRNSSDCSLEKNADPKVELDKKIKELGYIKKEEDMSRIQVIPPQESWEQDYPTITLTYYENDGVLADEKGKIISNADELVGKDFASHFGEFEEDSVYIRNDNLKVYYEILRDYGDYYTNEA